MTLNFSPYIAAVRLILASRRRVQESHKILERKLKCAQEEIASLTRQRDAALDMVDRDAWRARYEMAVHKAGAEGLRDESMKR